MPVRLFNSRASFRHRCEVVGGVGHDPHVNVSTLLASAAISAVPAVAVAWWSGHQAGRRAARTAREDRCRDAADKIRNAIWTLHDLVWDVIIEADVDARRVARAMSTFEAHATRYEDLLPQGAGHFKRSAREAMTSIFGAPAVAGLHARAATQPVNDPDRYWADVSVSWLEHAAQRLHEWQDEPGRRRLKIEPFYSWRRAEDEVWRAAARTEGRL